MISLLCRVEEIAVVSILGSGGLLPLTWLFLFAQQNGWRTYFYRNQTRWCPTWTGTYYFSASHAATWFSKKAPV